MKKTIAILNLLLFASILVGDLCYMEFGGLEIKTPTSLGFVLLGAINLFYAVRSRVKGLNFPIVMVVGLVFAMLGDVFINIEFIVGAALFALGHVFYFVAFCRYERFGRKDLIPSGILFLLSASILLFVPFFDFGGALMQAVCLVYALVISLMFGKAISNFIGQRNAVTVTLAVGCSLFWFSDLMLVFDMFSNVTDLADTLCLITYYPAQCLLAHSIFQFTNKEKEP